MLFPLESFAPEVARRVRAWEREIFTGTETVGWLMDRLAFAVEDFPDGLPAVAEALGSIPASLIAGMAERLAECRMAGGGWHWPPGGVGLADPIGWGPWAIAEPQQAAALDALDELLRGRVTANREAEQTAAGDGLPPGGMAAPEQ